MGLLSHGVVRIRETSSRSFLIIELLFWSILARLIANLYGLLYSLTVPVFLRQPLYTFWSKLHGVDTSEIEKPFDDYPTLNAFFTRYLKPGLRPIANGSIVCPIDGYILEHFVLSNEGLPDASSTGQSSSQQELQTERLKRETGAPGQGITIEETFRKNSSTPRFARLPNFITNIKGAAYSMEDLFGIAPPPLPSQSRYHFFSLHLPPDKYHHVHCPVDAVITHSLRIPGHVGRFHWARFLPQLLWTNERVVLLGRWRKDLFFSIVLIAATAFVASINIAFDPTIMTNYPWDPLFSYRYLSGNEPTHVNSHESKNATVYTVKDPFPIPVK